MSLVEACVCLAHSVSVMLGACACILRAADAYAGNEAFYTHSVHMLQAMWIGAMCVFAYFHVTMETTNPIINTPKFFLRIMLMLFFVGPFAYCPIFTLLHWIIPH